MPLKVLVLEDDKDDMETLVHLVEKVAPEDAEILPAYDMQTALRVAFRASPPCLILADQNLGVSTGAAFLHIALEQCPQANAVLLTGMQHDALPGEVRIDLAKGLYQYLSKSDLDLNIIRSLVNKTLANAPDEAVSDGLIGASRSPASDQEYLYRN